MFLQFLVMISITSFALAADPLKPEEEKLSRKIVEVMKKQDAAGIKSLLHSKCPPHEDKIKSITSKAWTDRYQVRIKKLEETFDMKKTGFVAVPEYVMEFQVWQKTTPERELVKFFVVARENGEPKLLEWPCYEVKP